MKKIKRALHFDFHTMPGIDGLLSNFDAEEFAQKLQDNHVEYINVKARCNIGFSYYNTKVGKKYPGLERDILKEILDACHKRDIGVTAYFNGGLSHEFLIDHIDWSKIDKEGRVINLQRGGNFFRQMCYNSGYRAHLLAEVKEVVDNYDVDGIFIDCMNKNSCYCPKCLAKMKEKGLDTKNDEVAQAYQLEVITEVAKQIKAIVGKDKRLFTNGMRHEEVLSHMELECLPPAWGVLFFSVAAPYFRTRFDELWYMSGRFQSNWGDFGGIRLIPSLEHDLYDAMMQGYAISFGDHLHPKDGLFNEVIERVGKVFAKKRLYEPFDEDAKAVAETGVLINREAYAVNDLLKGAAMLLSELKIPYHIYDEYGDFSQMKLLIIPQKLKIDEVFAEKIRAFHGNGGKIIFCGSAVDNGVELGLLDYVNDVLEDKNDNAYFLTEKSDMRWAVYEPCRIIENKNGKELAKYVKNVFNYHYDDRHVYFYRPQGEATAYSAAVLGKTTACIAFDICTAYCRNALYEHKELFETAFNGLLPERFIEVEGLPSTARIAMTENDLNKIVHIKTSYFHNRGNRMVIEEHSLAKSALVRVTGEYAVYALPTMEKIESKTENGKTIFQTGDIEGYKAFSLREE